MKAKDIQFRCVCGARMRVKAAYAGLIFKCPTCATNLKAPAVSGNSLPSRISRPKQKAGEGAFCSICQCGIDVGDQKTKCPSCQLPFHVECWQANFGCAAYGCSQVGALKKGPDIKLAAFAPANPPPAISLIANSDDIPMEYVYLGASVFCFLLGLFAWGVPSLLCGFGCLPLFMRRQRCRRPGLVALGVIICVLGFILGILVRVGG